MDPTRVVRQSILVLSVTSINLVSMPGVVPERKIRIALISLVTINSLFTVVFKINNYCRLPRLKGKLCYRTVNSMVDEKMAAILQGDGGGFCCMCTDTRTGRFNE